MRERERKEIGYEERRRKRLEWKGDRGIRKRITREGC